MTRRAAMLGPALTAVLSLGLVSCAGLVGPQDDPFAIPRPFAGETRNAPTLRSVTAMRPVALREVEGLDADSVAALAAAMKSGADARDILFVMPDAAHWYDLRGRAVWSTDGLGIEWELLDPDGVEAMSFPTGLRNVSPGPLGPAAAQDLAAATLDRLAERLAPRTAATPAAEGVTRLPLTLLPIGGAPGDGDPALRAALGAILAQNPGLQLMETPGPGVLMLEGRIVLSPIADEPALERIDITWRLVAPDGRLLGTVNQTNAILKGALDGRWGATALDVANAAAGGIYDLLARVTAR